jgi:glycosyltransferase involved in cell wall biosynthesis
LWFTSFPEFEAVIERLVGDAELRATLGQRGRAYVDRFYQWPVLIARYVEFLKTVVARGRGVPGLL